jgi:DNA-nicking Smr family endonuclease
MRRSLRPDELRLWAAVAKTVRPARGRVVPVVEEAAKPAAKAKGRAKVVALAPGPKPARKLAPRLSPDPIEPGRKRRIVRERDPIDAKIDLHGLGQFEAQDRLVAFLGRAQQMGFRAVLVITGKGTRGDGVIKRRAPDWLADPVLREIVAGWSPAHHRHGGEGALYVAIKRKAARS